MSVKIGHASISERGTVNGSKGDSTKKEVCTREWYNKPWDFMAIHPDSGVREKHAAAVEAACSNNNIGYGQSDRNTLNTLAKANGYNLAKVGKCNCDCSSLQNVAAVASGAPGVTYGSNGWTTSNMKAKLTAAGYKIITGAYLKNAEYCVRGAIYVRAGSHTVCGLNNGSKATQTLKKAGISSGGAVGLTVDGRWGSSTTERLQKIFGTTADGVISNQHREYKDSNPGLTSGWEWHAKPNGKGSQLIKALQKWAGMPADSRDGEIGPATIKALQRKLGTTVDGKVSNPSQMVKALQKWANKQ